MNHSFKCMIFFKRSNCTETAFTMMHASQNKGQCALYGLKRSALSKVLRNVFGSRWEETGKKQEPAASVCMVSVNALLLTDSCVRVRASLRQTPQARRGRCATPSDRLFSSRWFLLNCDEYFPYETQTSKCITCMRFHECVARRLLFRD